MWQGKMDDKTEVAVAMETEGKMWVQEDPHELFEDPDITLKAFREMLQGEDRLSSPETLSGPSRIHSGTDPPDHGPSGGTESTDERAVRTFLRNSVHLHEAIVDRIITEGGVTKLAVLKYVTVEDLIRWKTPFVMARYLIEEAVPMMLRDVQSQHKETHVNPVLMTQQHVHASVVNNSPVAHAHAKAAVNLEHLRSHVESSNSTVTPDINSSVSMTITQGHGAELREEPSANRLSPAAQRGPPAMSTGLTPVRQVDRFPIFEVCENCSTQDQTVITCRIDPQTLMKLCKPCANMVRTVHSGRNSSSSSSSDGVSVETRSSQGEEERYDWVDPGPHPFHPPMRATDLGGSGSGLSVSRAASAFLTYVQRQAPDGLEMDKVKKKIDVNGPEYEHYMDMIPMLAVQLDAQSPHIVYSRYGSSVSIGRRIKDSPRTPLPLFCVNTLLTGDFFAITSF